jgi:hypothetical protein
MSRELSDRDRQILEKLLPEMEELQELGMDLEYMNILPPVANHHSQDEADFEQRLKRLSVEDMRYLAEQVFQGVESLSCLHPRFAEVFFTVAGQRLSSETADRLRDAYEEGGQC